MTVPVNEGGFSQAINHQSSFHANFVRGKSKRMTEISTLATQLSKKMTLHQSNFDQEPFTKDKKNKKPPLKMKFSFFDYMTAYLPDKFYNSAKKKILKNGMEMINQKLDIKSYINAMNELEKLKLLLFDETQYFLFEHIPKPVLIDEDLIKPQEESDSEDEVDEEVGETERGLKKKKPKKSKSRVSSILACNAQFWARRTTEQRQENFKKALESVRKRDGEGDGRQNIIDQRLLEILDHIGQ